MWLKTGGGKQKDKKKTKRNTNKPLIHIHSFASGLSSSRSYNQITKIQANYLRDDCVSLGDHKLINKAAYGILTALF